jgi:hypothetical protein
MANTQKCHAGTEATEDSLLAILNKAFGYPVRGVHIGPGRHVSMPFNWDGKGETPPGWTRDVTLNYVASASDAAVAFPDSLATAVQQPGPQSKLTPGEQGQLTAAINSRAVKDLEAGGYSPKANQATAGAAVALGNRAQ